MFMLKNIISRLKKIPQEADRYSRKYTTFVADCLLYQSHNFGGDLLPHKSVM
jgi:hypothetical protein